MRILTRLLLAFLLVLNGLAGAHAPGLPLPPGMAVDAAAVTGSGAHGDHCGEPTPTPPDAAGTPPFAAPGPHGGDCCQAACQCACTAQSLALFVMPPPWPPGPSRAAVADPRWPSLRPPPLLRPPIA